MLSRLAGELDGWQVRRLPGPVERLVATRDGAHPPGVVRRAHGRPGRPAHRSAARGRVPTPRTAWSGRPEVEIVPLSVGVASRAWDQQNIDLASAAELVGEAGTGGFTAAVSGPAGRFTSDWQRFTRRPRHPLRDPGGRPARAHRDLPADRAHRAGQLRPRALPAGAAMTARIVIPAEPAGGPAARGGPGRDPRVRAGPALGLGPGRRPGRFVAGEARIGDWQGSDAAATTRRSARSGAGRTRCRWRCAASTSRPTSTPTRWSSSSRTAPTWRPVAATRRSGSRGSGSGPTAPPRKRRPRSRPTRTPAAGLRDLAAAVTAWQKRVTAAEQRMLSAFSRVATVEQVEKKYGGVPDPADEPLARLPSVALPRRSTPGGTASPGRSSWRSSRRRPGPSATWTASPRGPAPRPTRPR